MSTRRAQLVALLVAAAATVGGLLSAPAAHAATPAPARTGNAPLTHYSGWNRFVDATGASDWMYASPDSQAASTLGGGVWMEVRWPGRCTDPAHGNVVKVARPGHRQRCG